MAQDQQHFVPAFGLKVLTPFYDWLIARTSDEGRWRAAFVRQMTIPQGSRVVEIGCGTGSLLATAAPLTDANLVGVDPDPEVLRQAQAKLAPFGGRTTLIRGFGNQLPAHAALQPSTFDRAACCLLLHHLTRDQKRQTLTNVYDLLKPGGELHIADWTKPQSLKMRLAYLQIRMIDGFATTGDNAKGLLPTFMQEAGFIGVEETLSVPSRFGQFGFFKARKAG